MKNKRNCFLDGHRCIIWSNDHYNPLGMVRSLGEIGVAPIVILVGDKPFLVTASKYPCKIHIVSTNEQGYELLLREYGRDAQKAFVFTASEDTTEYLNSHYDEIIDKFYFFNCGPGNKYATMAKKEVQNEIAQRVGLDVARYEVLNVGELPHNLRYPVITKSIDSLTLGWKENKFVCQSEDELLKAYEKIKESKIMVQEYVEKKTEITIEGISFNHGKDILIPLRSMFYRVYKDTFGCYTHFDRLDDIELKSSISDFFKEVRYDGIFEMEFIVDGNDKLHFLELNMRNSGLSYFSTSAGYNLPYTWAKSLLSKKMRNDLLDINKLPHICMYDLIEFRYDVVTGNINVWQFIKELKTCDCFTFWNKKDNGPFWAMLRMMIYRGLKKLLKRLLRTSK